MDKNSLGDRMKGYENIPRIYLTPRTPVIIRVDGKAFHTYTKSGFSKPWDERLQGAMTGAAKMLLDNVQGAEMAYIQSDEISLVLNTYKNFATQQYFDGNVQKIASVAASIATAGFNREILRTKNPPKNFALFDARCFTIPREEVVNYFYWRQQDAIRNSIQGFGQANFSHKKLHGLSTLEVKKLLITEKNIDWDKDIPIKNQRGWCLIKKVTNVDNVVRSSLVEDLKIPLFNNDRKYIEKYLIQEEI